MLPKVHRLSQDKEIQQAFRTRYRSQTESFRIFVGNTEVPQFKLLIIVPKKIFKRANERNRLRRKVSAIFEDLLSQQRLPPQVSCILQVTKQKALYKNVKAVQEEIIPQVSLLYSQIICKQKNNFSKQLPS